MIKYHIPIKSLLWLTPFLCFFLGYQCMQLFQPKQVLVTPNIVGDHIYTAIKNLSAKNLNLRIISEQIDPHLPDQVIVSQKPYAGQSIKHNQTIYVVTTRKPQPTAVPNLVGQTAEQVQATLQNLGLKNSTYQVPSNQPTGICIAQLPETGTALHKNQIITYISAGADKPVLMPDLRNLTLAQVANFLDQQQIAFTVVNLNPAQYQQLNLKTHSGLATQAADQPAQNNLSETTLSILDYTISDQRPLPGTIIDRAKLTLVKLKVGYAK